MAMGVRTMDYIEIDHPWISNALMPIYRWTFPSEASDKELHACLEAREEWAIRARYPSAWVIDMSNITKAPALQRKAVAQHLKRFDQYGARHNAGSAIIVPSPWLRGLVTAVTWVSPPSFPYRLFADAMGAEHWAKQQLARKLAEP